MAWWNRALGAVGGFLSTKAWGSGVWRLYGGSEWIPKGAPWNFWQSTKYKGLGGPNVQHYGPVFTCHTILSQDTARIPIHQWNIDAQTNVRTLTTNAAANRVFRKPNHYQTRTEFMRYLMWSMLSEGNGYAIAKRNERNEVEELYPINPRSMYPYIAADGSIYYNLGGDPTVDLADVDAMDNGSMWFRQRDVLHAKMHTPIHPLMGESPLVAALFPALTGQAINQHMSSFFHNMGRPSGILRHPGKLSDEGMDRLKKRFAELVSGPHTGEPLVLREGMEWTQLTMSAVDADVARIAELSNKQVLQIYRVPAFLAGELPEGGVGNVEALTRWYINSSLGFYVEYWENLFTDFFGLRKDQAILFDLDDVLLRTDLVSRMEAYGKAVQNGVLAPNEARAKEHMPPLENGEHGRLQQQLVTFDFGVIQAEQLAQETVNEAAPAAEPVTEPAQETVENAVTFLKRKMAA